jgi:hypothetical protein
MNTHFGFNTSKQNNDLQNMQSYNRAPQALQEFWDTSNDEISFLGPENSESKAASKFGIKSLFKGDIKVPKMRGFNLALDLNKVQKKGDR